MINTALDGSQKERELLRWCRIKTTFVTDIAVIHFYDLLSMAL